MKERMKEKNIVVRRYNFVLLHILLSNSIQQKFHRCPEVCFLEECTRNCVNEIDDVDDHKEHKCDSSQCPFQCQMPGCRNECSSDNHFHHLALKDSSRSYVVSCLGIVREC